MYGSDTGRDFQRTWCQIYHCGSSGWEGTAAFKVEYGRHDRFHAIESSVDSFHPLAHLLSSLRQMDQYDRAASACKHYKCVLWVATGATGWAWLEVWLTTISFCLGILSSV